jgi:cyclopropane fatty-acyl-phospholipid synthase-like methyltransferase
VGHLVRDHLRAQLLLQALPRLRHRDPKPPSRLEARFMRIWEFYLAYCEAAFAMGNTDVMQFTLQHD